MVELGLHLAQPIEDDEGLFPADGALSGTQHRDGLTQDGNLRGEIEDHHLMEHAFASRRNPYNERPPERSHACATMGSWASWSPSWAVLDRLYSKLATSGKRDGAGLSLRTVRYVHSIIGKALADAERKGLVNRNVARLASPPATSSTRAPEMTAWTPAELRAFLDSVADHHHGALYRLAAMTGLRRAEVCGLRWADVDLDGGVLRVRQTITSVQEPTGADEGPKTRRTLVVGDTKTARSRRTLDLDPGTIATLRSHRTAQLEQRMLMGGGWTDHGLVFAMPDGQPWNPDVLTRGFDRLVRASDLPRIRLHDLRHTHASHLLAAGVNVKVVSDRLGHASVAFTLDVYGHVLPGQQADAAARVAALVDEA